MIDDNAKIEIYTSRSCGYCHAAKALLESQDLEFTEIDVTLNSEKRNEMIVRSNQRSVPQIFIDGKSIGGFRELARLLG